MLRKTQDTVTSVDGEILSRMFAAGRSSLESHVPAINALNVFPVPDGDTGTNMLFTLKAADNVASTPTNAGAGVVAAAMARGALMGARGNSGVILSQFLQGWAHGLDECDSFDGPQMASALGSAAEWAYKAVSKPVEGTILTVAKGAARAAQDATQAGERAPVVIWDQACHGARRALAETPELLPVLKEAGVVDAGGLGLLAMMEGIRAFLVGEEVAPLDEFIGQVKPTEAYLSSTEHEAYGYCTQFLIQGESLDLDELRRHMETITDSTIVVGDSSAVRVHVHTYDPGPVISYGVTQGGISEVKIDNIDQQRQDFLLMHREGKQETVPLGVVAVVAGEGMERIFRDLGVGGLVPGGQTMNPSAGELVECAAGINAEQVILLPNNSNIVSAARQAASVSAKPLHVLDTTSIPQGIAALLAFDPLADLKTNLSVMLSAMSGLRSGEVTVAVRSATVSGRRVRQGQAIALMDGELVAASRNIPEVLEKLCTLASPAAGTLITLYWGGDIRESDALLAAQGVRACCPGAEVDVVYGGQPYYDYLVSIE